MDNASIAQFRTTVRTALTRAAAWARPRIEPAARTGWRWVKGHKAIVVAGLLAFYILFWPKAALRGPDHVSAAATSSRGGGTERPARGPAVAGADSVPATQPTTRPTTQPVTAQLAGDLPLYMPDQEGADPGWGLPAELRAG